MNWNDVAEFCERLSQQEQLQPFYFRSGDTITALDGTGYRLPTEAEWEFACRAGTTTRFWIGDQDSDLMQAGWFVNNSGGRTHSVGDLETNPFGLSDIHGNVFEWVEDSWEPMYYAKFAENTAIDPSTRLSAGSLRLFRGGGWRDPASTCRSSDRYASASSTRSFNLGFRVVLAVDAVKAAIDRQTISADSVPE